MARAKPVKSPTKRATGEKIEQVKLTKELIHGFVSSLLLRDFDDPAQTPSCHFEWWELCCSDHPKVAIAAPRRHAKSSALTISYGLAAVLFRTHDYVIIVSDSSGQASQFLSNIKDELADNEELRKLFKISTFLKENETDLICMCEDGHQFRISARGSEQKLRGLIWRKKRPNLILCDDLEGDEQVLNDERRVKFREWFYSALIPSLSYNGKIRVFGTILHMDSLLQRLMPEIDGKNTVTEELKASYKDLTDEPWVSVKYKAHNPDFSKILWSERYNRKWFEDAIRDFKSQGLLEKYSQEYLNHPIDESTTYFKRADFKPITNPNEHLIYYVGCDLAISQKKRAAYTAMAVVGVNAPGKIKVVNMRRFRGDAYDIINELFTLQEQYKPEVFFMEQENIARSLGAVIDKEMLERDTYLNISPVIATHDKVQRARAFQARVRAGVVEWDMAGDWYQLCFNELTTFPRSTYKDQTDALAIIGLGLNSVYEAKNQTERDLEDREVFEDEVMGDTGRCYMTGY